MLCADGATPSWHVSVHRAGGPCATSFHTAEPGAADAARSLLLALSPPRPGGRAALRPAAVFFAARCGAAAEGMAPLLALLGIRAAVEAWPAAAASALDNDTDPWGFNARSRCAGCHRAKGGAGAAAGGRLRRCLGCRIARYCDAGCQDRDWAQHKAMCAYIAARRGGAG